MTIFLVGLFLVILGTSMRWGRNRVNPRDFPAMPVDKARWDRGEYNSVDSK